MRLSLLVVPALIVLALWAVGCGNGDGNGDGNGNGGPDGAGPAAIGSPGTETAGPAATSTPGPPGSITGEPLAFGATGHLLDALEITVDRWELLECVPADLTPAPEGEKCPDGSAKNRALRYFISLSNTSDGETVEGPFTFFLAFGTGAFANVPVEDEDVFPSTKEALGPGETINGYVYSVRPDLERWEAGIVRVQGNIGPDVGPESVIFWLIPPP